MSLPPVSSVARAFVGLLILASACASSTGCEVSVGKAPDHAPPVAQAAPPAHPVVAAPPPAAHPAAPPPTTPVSNGVSASQTTAHASVVRPVRVKDAAERAKMESFVHAVQAKEQVHSFELAGHQVDCVPAHKQPAALRVPLTHGIPTAHVALPPRPAFAAAGHAQARAFTAGVSSTKVAAKPTAAAAIAVHQTHPGSDAQGALRRCPTGTVPVQRTTIEQVASFRTLADFNHKPRPPAPSSSGNAFGEANPHEHAALWSDVSNQGVHGFLSVYAPAVEDTTGESTWGEFSLVQAWVLGYGVDRGYESLQSVEAGLQVWPQRYGDSLPHLFVYSTQDGYAETGCYEPCGKFVQTSQDVVIGGPLSTIKSTVDGPQYDIELAWWRGPDGWWLMLNGAAIGYYPAALYAADGLLNGANRYGFGGEIVNDLHAHPGRHTRTQMGSGRFPADGYGKSAFIRDIYYYDTPSTAAAAALHAQPDAKATCYDVSTMQKTDDGWGSHFFFGGAGFSDKCGGAQ